MEARDGMHEVAQRGLKVRVCREGGGRDGCTGRAASGCIVPLKAARTDSGMSSGAGGGGRWRVPVTGDADREASVRVAADARRVGRAASG